MLFFCYCHLSSSVLDAQILNLNVERTLIPKTRWFEETLGMERAQFAKMVSVTPALFGYSIKENMEPKVRQGGLGGAGGQQETEAGDCFRITITQQ